MPVGAGLTVNAVGAAKALLVGQKNFRCDRAFDLGNQPQKATIIVGLAGGRMRGQRRRFRLGDHVETEPRIDAVLNAPGIAERGRLKVLRGLVGRPLPRGGFPVDDHRSRRRIDHQIEFADQRTTSKP
ncbi:hypothetical protein SDC9_209031 [bioreactor metagenome]|uniref:Uncharacterized protein n=1 Tax=bioreactor metagenome TaxID=1076179 RepID=A0A645JCW9_9ZZZZ